LKIRAAFGGGVRAAAPILLGIIPFGLITGISAADAGLNSLQTIGTSVIIFAGAAQLAAIDLWRQDALAAVVVTTVLVINARHLMYSASIAPQFKGLSFGTKAGAAYLLTDQAYVLSIIPFQTGKWTLHEKLAHYLGAALSLWVTWQITTVIGMVAGSGLPDGLSLAFAIPLVFLALLIPAVQTRPSLVAAVVAGVVAMLSGGLPYNSGLLLAASAGIVAGMVAGRWRP